MSSYVHTSGTKNVQKKENIKKIEELDLKKIRSRFYFTVSSPSYESQPSASTSAEVKTCREYLESKHAGQWPYNICLLYTSTDTSWTTKFKNKRYI